MTIISNIKLRYAVRCLIIDNKKLQIAKINAQEQVLSKFSDIRSAEYRLLWIDLVDLYCELWSLKRQLSKCDWLWVLTGADL